MCLRDVTRLSIGDFFFWPKCESNIVWLKMTFEQLFMISVPFQEPIRLELI